VEFLGGVTRDRLIQEQMKAQIHYYPFNGGTEELFCISVAESQVAGVLPITSADGALATTNMGVLIEGSVREGRNLGLFVEKTVSYLQNPSLPEMQEHLRERARDRFDINRILKEWDEKIFNE
jgi:glycosyltransferase involved in cell wall biosynthesis